MGIFSKGQKDTAEQVYEDMKKSLSVKDGNTHVVMVNSFGKWLNQTFQCDDKYTTQLDTIVTRMQEDGYEIVDIKFNSLMNQGLGGNMEGFHTLIMYK